MASDKSGKPTFPVWVGSLDEAVNEKELRKTFAKFGNVSSVKLMTDPTTGKSKRFGWVNFYSRVSAEEAAVKLAGCSLRGSVIKTSGPAELERRDKKGLFSPPKTNFRPFTDCSFFIQGKVCKKGAACEYRHSEQALSTEVVCTDWRNKKCINRHCRRRHPSSSRKSTSSSAGTPPPIEVSGGGGGVQVCGGRCGDHSCSLSFSSAHTLLQHIQLGQLHCTTCNMVCASQAELQEHKRLCSRPHRDSASTHSLSSSDIEVLSDNESEDSHKLSPSEIYVTGQTEGGNRRERRQKRGRQGRKKIGVSESTSEANIGQTVTPKYTRSRNFSSEAVIGGQPPLSGAPHYSPTAPQIGLDIGNVNFEVGSDSSEESEDDDLVYTPAEMAQLLSLNEQDMHPYTSEEESEGDEADEERDKEEVKDTEEGRETWWEGEKKKRRRNRVNKRKKTNSESTTSEGTDADMKSHPSFPRPTPQRTLVHARQPEPVGLFWDIENCSVPVNKSAFGVAAKMRRVFFEGKREAEFMVVCDITKERKEITDALNKAQVTLVHVNAVAKNAADDKLRQSLRRFAHTYPAPSTVVLVSSDVNFSSELNDLRHVHNMTIVLVHSRFTSDALKVFAQQLVSYEQFLEDVEGPKQSQTTHLPNILLISNLPNHIVPKKISSRLGQLSDNCGGRVLGVDTVSGTARILFRTHDWAVKAEKRMKGENVFGYKINVFLDYSQQQLYPPPPSTHPHPPTHSPLPPHPHPPPPTTHPHPLQPRPLFPTPQLHHQNFHNLSGGALGNTFPPANRPPPNHPPMQHSSPLPRSHPPRMIPTPGQNFPLLGSPPGPPPNMQYPSPPRPNFPPSPRQPTMPPASASYSKMASTPAPRPEGKILIFKIPATAEPAELDRQVVTMLLEANIKMEQNRVVMWHNYSEMQMLLRLDFRATAVVRKDELIVALWNKGDIKPKVAETFVEQCVKSLSEHCQRRCLSWQVTACGWSEDEESDRLTRSQVIGLLRRYPLLWVNWTHFKKKYNKVYHSALSEMAVHTTCKGAVMILGKPDNNESQVIIRYEMSPLVRISSQQKFCNAVLGKIINMLSTRPDHKIKLLDVVRELTTGAGPLPISANGRPLQEVLASSPHLQFVGSKPSSIYLTLTSHLPPTTVQSPPTAKTVQPSPMKRYTGGGLNKLSTEFRHLLKMQSPKPEIPLSRLQQEYQTFYHRSFRVSDYVNTDGDGSRMRQLVEACTGIEAKTVTLPNKRTELIVVLESEQSQDSATPVPVQQQQPPISIVECERRVRNLLCGLPDYQITLGRFMGEYEKKYGSKMSYYGHTKLSGVLETFKSTLILSEVKGPTRLVQLQPIHILTHEITLILSSHGGRLAINQIVPEYKEMFGRHPIFSQYGFTKLIKALETMSDTITISGKGASRIAILKKPVLFNDAADRQQFIQDVTVLLMCTHTKQLSTIQLTRNYNEIFRGPATTGKLPPITAADMVETLKKIPGFSLSGSGPVQYVALIEQSDKEKLKKGKTKVSETQPMSLPEQQPPSEPTLFHPPSIEQVITTDRQQFIQDVTVLLMCTHTKKLLTIQLTRNYNEIFRGPATTGKLPPITAADMVETLKKIPGFSLSGSGSVQYVALIEQSDKEKKNKGKTKVSETQPMSPPEQQPPSEPTLFHPPSIEQVITTDRQQFIQDVTVLLMSTHTKQLLTIQLTRNYNEIFRGPATTGKLPPITAADMVETLKKIPGFSLSGSGSVQHVALIEQSDKEKKNKGKTKVSETQPMSPPEQQPPPSEPTLFHPPSIEQVITSTVEAAVSNLLPNLSPVLSHHTSSQTTQLNGIDGDVEVGTDALNEEQNVTFGNTGGQQGPLGGACGQQGPLGGACGQQGPLDGAGSQQGPLGGAGGPGPSKGQQEMLGGQQNGASNSVLQLEDKESQRLASETQRLLQCHPEHAMTIGELVQSFQDSEDPAKPQAEELHLYLNKHNIKRGGSKSPRIFQISSIPGSVSDSMVQLNRADCLGKLAMDLLHIFVCQPTPQLTLPLVHVDSLYQQCYGRKLIPAVYGMVSLVGVIEMAKPVSQVIKLDDSKQFCSLTDLGRRRVMSSLLVELLYLHGDSSIDTVADLPHIFQQHFGFPLPLALLKMDSPTELLALHEIQNCIQVIDGRPILKNVTLFAERLRLLLSQNNGRLPLDVLKGLYISSFGPPPDTHGNDWLDKKLIHYAPHVVNITGYKRVVWAPAGRPYPTRRNGNLFSATTISSSSSLPTEGVEATAESEDTAVDNALELKSVSDAGQVSSVEDLLQMEEGGMGREKKLPPTTSQTYHQPLLSNSLDDVPLIPPPNKNKDTLNSAVTWSTSNPNGKERVVPYDESPYGFLEKDTELLAQMNVKEEDGENFLSTTDALQRLIAAGKPNHDFDIPDLPPPIPLLYANSGGNQSHNEFTKVSLDGSTDYLEAGLEPDEVLQELYRVKDSGGGIINPASMEPFLSYFGELSSRELERLESQETKPAAAVPTAPKTTSPTPTKLRKKRMMAIRFPGQGPDPNDIDPDLQRTLESIQLPDIPNSSDEEEDTTLPLRPVTRAELLAKLVGEDFATSLSSLSCHKDTKEESSNVVAGSVSSNSTNTSTEPDAKIVSKPPSFPRYYEQGQQ